MATSKIQSTEVSSPTKTVNQSMTSNLESFTCLWLDQHVNSTQYNRDVFHFIIQSNKNIRRYFFSISIHTFLIAFYL